MDKNFWISLSATDLDNIIEIIEEAFTAYSFRWKIEEYHRHIKQGHYL